MYLPQTFHEHSAGATYFGRGNTRVDFIAIPLGFRANVIMCQVLDQVGLRLQACRSRIVTLIDHVPVKLMIRTQGKVLPRPTIEI